MNVELARAIVLAAAAYAAIGLAVGVPFVLRGAGRIDPSAAQGSWGFRLLLLPGAVALWPLVLRRWRAGALPTERNAHRRAAVPPGDPT